MRYNIGVLAGDGIGPEIVAQARKVLDAVAKKFNHQFEYTEALVGASAIDEVGDPFPQETLKICLESDAVLFGAIGDPRYDNDPSARVRPEQGLLAMRKQLGLYANIRPVKAFEKLLHKSPLKEDRVKGVDFTVVRELTGGLYFGQPQGRTENGETAFDSCVYSKFEIERICRKAFELAMQRRKKLTVVDKANVLATSRLWRETAQGLEKEYPEVETSYLFVDNAAMQLIQNPAQFDVMVTENMFGDILTDEASVITGSLGLLPSASVGAKTSVFEPIHGSYPQAAGKDIANPLGTVLSAALLLKAGLGLKEEAACIEEAVNASLDAGYCTEDINAENPKKTSEVGDWLANHVLATCECEGES
jgi:3-isopropylmalate dehydrogenase